MALHSLKPALGLCRLFANAGRAGFSTHTLNVADEASALLSSSSNQGQEQHQQHHWSNGALLAKLGPGLLSPAMSSGSLESEQQQPTSAALPDRLVPSGALASMLRTTRRSPSPLLSRRTSLRPLAALAAPSLAAGVQQGRQYYAWSPEQRYFVEGDHVITAELGRTLQFTGLDSGSFAPFIPYTLVAGIIASVFMVLPYLVAPSRVDLDKSSAYECGFDAFGEARQTFSISFYLVSIMYLLFDIEIAYLFPYVMSHANGTMFWTMNLFLAILVTGFIYEWGVGALEWRE